MAPFHAPEPSPAPEPVSRRPCATGAATAVTACDDMSR